MSEQQPAPYGYDERDPAIDELIRAVREYCSVLVLADEADYLGPSRLKLTATERVLAARQRLKARMPLTP